MQQITKTWIQRDIDFRLSIEKGCIFLVPKVYETNFNNFLLKFSVSYKMSVRKYFRLNLFIILPDSFISFPVDLNSCPSIAAHAIFNIKLYWLKILLKKFIRW